MPLWGVVILEAIVLGERPLLHNNLRDTWSGPYSHLPLSRQLDMNAVVQRCHELQITEVAIDAVPLLLFVN